LIELFYVILAFCAIAFVAVYAHYDFLKKLLEGCEEEIYTSTSHGGTENKGDSH